MINEMKDVTSIYSNMLIRIGHNFDLAAELSNDYGLDDIQKKIEDNDRRVLKDIQKLNRLVHGLQAGYVKISTVIGSGCDIA